MDSYLNTKEHSNSFCHRYIYICALTLTWQNKQHIWHHSQTLRRQSWPSCNAAHHLSWEFFSSRGVGGVQSREKIKKQNVNWRTWHSGSFLSITVWRTIISCLCVWEIINFRKTKYVKFIPGASDYFCVFKTGSVGCDDILKAICYLLISSHAFYLSCGLKGKL